MTLIDTIHTLTLTEKRDLVKTLKAIISDEVANKRQAKIDAKAAKAANIAAKREAAIAKAQLRLQKLLDKKAAPVGAKANKVNKRPSKAIVTKFGAEDNAIANAIMAKKKTA